MGASRVLKFGGAALRDGKAVERAVGLVRRFGGPRPALVVSAHHGVTRQLHEAFQAARAGRLVWDPVRIRHRTILRQLGLEGDILDRPLRELREILSLIVRSSEDAEGRLQDYVLSFGERMSARVVSAFMRAQGLSATPVDAFDLGLRRLEPLRDARRPDSLGDALRGIPGIPVVTGFLAVDDAGDLATLGPNGSDLTAVWIALALGAEHVQFWKAVDGLSSADPELVPDALPIPACDWSFVRQLTSHGAVILHPACLDPAERAHLPLEIRRVDLPDETGTHIGPRLEGSERPRALAHRPHVLRLRLPPTRATWPPEQLLAQCRGVELYATCVRDGGQDLYLVEDRPGAGLIRIPGVEAQPEPGWGTLSVVGADAGRSLRGGLLASAHRIDAEAVIVRTPGAPGALTCVLHSRHLPAAARRVHRDVVLSTDGVASGADPACP